jgi:aminoglycoside phosphotransferase
VLSPADRDLARRDAEIPGLATLLDPDAFAAALSAHLRHVEIESATPTYVRYKPGMNFLIEYELETGGKRTLVYAKAHGPDAPVKLRNATRKPGVVGALGAAKLVLEELGVVVSFFPNDAKLKELKRLADGDKRRKMLKEILPGHPELREGELQTLRYKPERRYVAHLSAGSEAAIVKFYTEPGYRQVRTNAAAFTETFKTSGPLRLARLLGCSDEHNAVALEWLPGLSLATALAAPGLQLGAVENVGAALAELHAQDPEELPHLTRQEEANALLAVVSEVGFTCPHLAGVVHELAGELTTRLLREPPVGAPIHGDFYDEQVLISGDHVAILDLDRAVRGDPAADLGAFLAHLERDTLHAGLPPERVEALRMHLLEGYGSATPLPERIDLYTAAALLRLAPEPFRHRDPDWPERTAAVLARAREVLRETPAHALRR